MAANYYTSGGDQYVNNYQLPDGSYYSGLVSGIPKSSTTSTPTSTSTEGTRTAVTLGNGTTVYYDTSGIAWTSASGGSPVSNDVVASSTYNTTSTNTTTAGAWGSLSAADKAALTQYGVTQDQYNSAGSMFTGTWLQSARQQYNPSAAPITTTPTTGTTDADLQKILSNPALSADMKASIQAIYDATVSGDADKAAKLVSAMSAASQFSDPYFKAQIQLATDALQRGISGKEGDLNFNESQLQNALKLLQDNTSASKDQLSFQHAQELKQLEQKYQTDLSTTQDNLAAAGFTSSSKRARAEQILSDNNTGLVESSNKQFGYQTANLDRALAASSVSTADQIANLQRLAAEGKLDLYRTTEGTVGSANLPSVSGLTPLGGVGGDIPEKQVTDALQFANSFVF